MLTVPFNKPAFPERAFEHMRGAIERGYLAGDGHFTRTCEQWIEARLGVERALLTTSGTSALEMALLLLDLGPGDEVVLPSFTFVSCANAVVLRGATPVFADIDPVTLSITIDTISKCVTPRTRAVMAVHYAGLSRGVVELADWCRVRDIAFVEDAAHAFLGLDGDRHSGTIGDLAAFSFHETKNFSMGEGGALICNSTHFAERAEIIREKGTNRKQFFKGLVDKYSWVDVGSSYVPSDLLAAVLWSQLEDAESICAQRSASWRRYRSELTDWSAEHNVRLPLDDPGHTHHGFFLLFDNLVKRDRFLDFARANGVNAVFHYLPLERSPFGLKFAQHECPVANAVADGLARLPLFPGMGEEECEHVIDVVRRFTP